MISGLQTALDAARTLRSVPELVQAIIRECASEAGVPEYVIRPLVEGLVVDAVARRIAWTPGVRSKVLDLATGDKRLASAVTSVLVVADHTPPTLSDTVWTSPITGAISRSPIGRGVPPPGTDAVAVVSSVHCTVGSLWVIACLPFDWADQIAADELVRMARSLNGGTSDE